MQGDAKGIVRLFRSTQTLQLLELIGVIFLLMLSVLILVSLSIRLFRVFTREADSCPWCHGNDVRRAHYRDGPKDWIMARLGCAAMRCRNCHGRYYAPCEDTSPLRHRAQKAR